MAKDLWIRQAFERGIGGVAFLLRPFGIFGDDVNGMLLQDSPGSIRVLRKVDAERHAGLGPPILARLAAEFAAFLLINRNYVRLHRAEADAEACRASCGC